MGGGGSKSTANLADKAAQGNPEQPPVPPTAAPATATQPAAATETPAVVTTSEQAVPASTTPKLQGKRNYYLGVHKLMTLFLFGLV